MDFPGSVLAVSCWRESFWALWNLMVWLSLLHLLPSISDCHVRIWFIIAHSCWRRATGFSWIEGWSLHVYWTLLSVAVMCKGKNSHQILTSVITSYINGMPLIPKDLLTLSTLKMPPAAPGICCWPRKCSGLLAEMELCPQSDLEHCWVSQ